jgi:hypothetical protein
MSKLSIIQNAGNSKKLKYCYEESIYVSESIQINLNVVTVTF